MTQAGMTMGGGWTRWRIAGWTLAAALLMLPLAAMQFTDEVRWTASDFVFAGVLIGAVGGGLELAMRRSRDRAYRAGAALALFACCFILWVNAAVGIVGDEGESFNLLYVAVVANAVAGSIGAGLDPRGLMRTTALSAASLTGIGMLAIDPAGTAPPGPAGLAVLHAVMAGMFAASALLFRQASRAREGAGG